MQNQTPSCKNRLCGKVQQYFSNKHPQILLARLKFIAWKNKLDREIDLGYVALQDDGHDNYLYLRWRVGLHYKPHILYQLFAIL